MSQKTEDGNRKTEKLGIVCGLEAEARLARRMQGALVACSGAKPDAARRLARDLIRQGATRLMSFGLIGGLDPSLKAGDLVLASSAQTEKQRWDCDPVWLERLQVVLPQALVGAVWGSDRIVAQASEKSALYRQTACIAADMESHAVAEVAAEAAVPFAALRAVSDESTMNLPEAALVPLREDGSVNGSGVAKSILKNPAQVFALAHVGYNTAKAMEALRRAIKAIPRTF